MELELPFPASSGCQTGAPAQEGEQYERFKQADQKMGDDTSRYLADPYRTSSVGQNGYPLYRRNYECACNRSRRADPYG